MGGGIANILYVPLIFILLFEDMKFGGCVFVEMFISTLFIKVRTLGSFSDDQVGTDPQSISILSLPANPVLNKH